MYGTSSGATRRRPAWGWLYAVLPLAFAMFAVVEVLEVTGAARIVLQLLATLVVFGALAAWVRANRTALDMTGARNVPGERRSLEHPSQWAEEEPVEVFGGGGHRHAERRWPHLIWGSRFSGVVRFTDDEAARAKDRAGTGTRRGIRAETHHSRGKGRARGESGSRVTDLAEIVLSGRSPSAAGGHAEVSHD